MSLFKFENFVLDQGAQHLSYKGVRVAIRPKVLKLLSLLIENRHRIVSKPEIFQSVWGSEFTRDHLLFQLISELRKLSSTGDFIRTQPNQGYQWVAATKVITRRTQWVPAIAASLFMCVIGLFSTAIFKGEPLEQATLLPAHQALSKGIVSLERGDDDNAIEWFEFALQENPDSVESSIFLAETLFRQDLAKESSERVEVLLQKTNLGDYDRMTATDLMSRIRQRQGRWQDAVRYAHESVDANVIGQCSADIVEQRIEQLERKIGSVIVDASEDSDNDALSAERVAPLRHYIERCNQLKEHSLETSSCRPDANEYRHYLSKQRVLSVLS